MFIFCVIIFFTTLVGLAAQLYTALTLQAQTVAYTVQAFKHEEYARGVLAYGISLLTHDNKLVNRIGLEKKVTLAYENWNTSEDGFLSASITYYMQKDIYCVEVSLFKPSLFERARFLQGIRAYIKDKKCVAIEPF